MITNTKIKTMRNIILMLCIFTKLIVNLIKTKNVIKSIKVIKIPNVRWKFLFFIINTSLSIIYYLNFTI
jgi:hypothetical protein